MTSNWATWIVLAAVLTVACFWQGLAGPTQTLALVALAALAVLGAHVLARVHAGRRQRRALDTYVERALAVELRRKLLTAHNQEGFHARPQPQAG